MTELGKNVARVCCPCGREHEIETTPTHLDERGELVVLAKGWEGRPGLWLMTAHGI